ncbi:MAG: hypothetical protein JO125_13345 [Chloroflexi bacterium]|nr:hypothetical protein [Chloroflexota bacterium]
MNTSHRHNNRSHHASGHRQDRFGRQTHGDSTQRRREFLWHERLRLHQELLRVNAQEVQVQLDLQALQQRKVVLESQRPKLVGQIILSGLVRRSIQTPDEMNFHYAMQRFHQEESELARLGNQCIAERMMLVEQIKVIESEIALL